MQTWYCINTWMEDVYISPRIYFLYHEDHYRSLNFSIDQAVKEIIELKRAKEKEKKERDRREKEFLQEQELKRPRHQTPRRPEFESSCHHQGVYPDTSIPARGIIGKHQAAYLKETSSFEKVILKILKNYQENTLATETL